MKNTHTLLFCGFAASPAVFCGVFCGFQVSRNTAPSAPAPNTAISYTE